jgi:hypothetical protein
LFDFELSIKDPIFMRSMPPGDLRRFSALCSAMACAPFRSVQCFLMRSSPRPDGLYFLASWGA